MNICIDCERGKKLGIDECRKSNHYFTRTVDGLGNEISAKCPYYRYTFPKLKPCPFCGSKAIGGQTFTGNRFSYFYAECSNGHCLVHITADTVEEVAKLWNRRAGEAKQ